MTTMKLESLLVEVDVDLDVVLALDGAVEVRATMVIDATDGAVVTLFTRMIRADSSAQSTTVALASTAPAMSTTTSTQRIVFAVRSL